MATIFKRKLYDTLLKWKQERQGKTAILIEGPRRVGKSTLAETFARQEYSSYIKIDFSIAPRQIFNIFDDISDLNYVFTQIQLAYNVVLEPRKSVIIFDEVQKQPRARQAIKHLVADGRYDYIETGSLISIRRNVADILIPSEETKVTLNPMDYEEFRWALGDNATIPLLRQAFDQFMPLSDGVNRKLMRDFRLYMLVGGMPQAVESYLNSSNLSVVDTVKRDIIHLYMDDFKRIDQTGLASQLFEAIPAQLNSNASRYMISSVSENARNSSQLSLVSEMLDSKTINIAYHSNDPNVGFPMHRDMETFKMYVCDTGLFVTLAFNDKKFTDNTIYNKLLNDKLSADLGYVFENAVAQMLVASGNKLFYYTFPKESSHHNFEIDFLLSRNNKICPIEVKSSSYKRHASLDAFSQKYSARIGNKYVVYTKDMRKEGDVLYIPIYILPFI